jgi:hypothetical protein
MKTTAYFEAVVRIKRPEIAIAWIEQVLANPITTITQPDGRICRWANIPEASGRALRMVTLDDGETIHNAFFDRNSFQKIASKDSSEVSNYESSVFPRYRYALLDSTRQTQP